ncbi:MAG: hypothetical protein Q9186_001008 [Xanthomendoza sp. 1 TL-2023]
MEASVPQVHVFASLYSFSDDAREQILSKFRINTATADVRFEWIDNKHLRVISNNEAPVTASFNLYADFIQSEKYRAHDPYDVSKLERSRGTFTKKMNAGAAQKEEADFYKTNTSLPSLVAHEMVSRVWSLEASLLKHTPRRLISPGVFENIANRTNCRIASVTEAGVVTVKSDNDQDLDEAMKRFAALVQALSLRLVPPQIHDFVNSEDETNIRFYLTSLNEQEASDHRSTTLIDATLLRQLSKPFSLAVILMTTGNGTIITEPRFRDSMLSHFEDSWQYALIEPYGDQDVNCLALESTTLGTHVKPDTSPKNVPPLETQIAPKTVEEWVATTLHTAEDPFKPLEPVEDPTSQLVPVPSRVDVIEADIDEGNDASGASGPKKRFGKIRKKPALQDIDDIQHNLDIGDANHGPTDAQSLQPKPSSAENSAEDALSSELIPHSESILPDTLVQVASTLSSSKAPSHSGSQLSPKPSTQNSSQDLLTGAGVVITYPVITPTPISQCRTTLSGTSTNTAASQAQARPLPPVWLSRNATAKAENGRPGLLIDAGPTAYAPRADYLAAAKRGNGADAASRSKGPQGGRAQGGRAQSRGGICGVSALTNRPQPFPRSENQFHEAKAAHQQVQTTHHNTRQVIGRTLHQITAKHPIDRADSPKVVESIVVQLLNSAERHNTRVRVGVEIGRLLITADSIEPTSSPRGCILFSSWSDIFTSRGRSKTDTIFTSRIEVLSPEHVVGAIQWHFPKRQWDARLTVKTMERIHSYEGAVKAINSSLSIIPSPDQGSAQIFADLGNSGLVFKSASIVRKVHFRSLVDQDITISCSEVQYLGVAKDRQRFFNSGTDRVTAETNGDLWWEISLESMEITERLQQNEDSATWKAEDIIQDGVTQRLHSMATNLVTQIDGIGKSIKQTATKASSKTFTEPRKPLMVPASVADTFW